MRMLSTYAILSILLLSAAVFAVQPGTKLDLRYWKLTLPVDNDDDGQVDEVDVGLSRQYRHPDFFYMDRDGFLVFAAPNKATRSENSSNTRSELRQMYRRADNKNSFALKASGRPKRFAGVGGQLDATLKVLHVSRNARYPNKEPAFSVVVGQIHAVRNSVVIKRGKGFGWGNAPIKIFYKKWPHHDKGSVFWTYERNLKIDDPDRSEIAYPVWGNTWDNPEDPGEKGIALGQLFKYNINVHGNIMYLTFRTSKLAQTVRYQIDLSNNVDAYGNVDKKDHRKGYSGDAMYFRAGAYNQCSTQDGPACAGSGYWEGDKANGDYVAVAFEQMQLSHSVDPDY